MTNKSDSTGGFRNRIIQNLIILDESGAVQTVNKQAFYYAVCFFILN